MAQASRWFWSGLFEYPVFVFERECSSGHIFLSKSDRVQEISNRAPSVSVIYVRTRRSFLSWVCVMQLSLLWIEPVCYSSTCGVQALSCKSETPSRVGSYPAFTRCFCRKLAESNPNLSIVVLKIIAQTLKWPRFVTAADNLRRYGLGHVTNHQNKRGGSNESILVRGQSFW